jgi:prepilin-type N-terminal cleavage/methylation domain-containing protein
LKCSCFHNNRTRSSGFTLIELLTVLAIIAVLTYLTIPMIAGLQKAGALNEATDSIATSLQQARAYAMANNTYVMVGFEETDFSVPRNQKQSTGKGRVAIQLFSSLNGTLDLTPANLMAVGRLQAFDNVHLAPPTTNTGTLANRMPPPALPTAAYIVGDSLPASTSPIVSGNYTFTQVMAFNPQGEIYLPTTTPPTTSLQFLEVDLQQSNGAAVPTPPSNNQSAIQIDGLVGAVSVYRS